jgi:hypothetical protein
MQESPVLDEADRDAALDILLLLADGRADEQRYAGALDLLEDVEAAGRRLPAEYEMKRLRWLYAS